ncbi:MAG: hypothetical protein KDD38_10560 [Bdellovibrionales bacterium]|nr:hypothetical protein [Bdellovibrionales bacterium]
MIEEKQKVVIVSAFGRGNWLAAEIQSTLGCEVHLVDVTDSLGRWTPEDWEGPFGLFQTGKLSLTQNARLDEEDYADAVEEGFCVWTKSGPLDLRGSHSNYLLEKRNIGAEVQEYLSDDGQISEKTKTELKKNIMNLPFAQSWLACLAHSIAGSSYVSSIKAMSKNQPLSIFSPFSVRRASRRGVEKSWDWVRSRRVKVYSKAKVKDIFIEGSSIRSVEIESDWSGVLPADQVIWALNGLETRRLGRKFEELLFSNAVSEPDWVWLRYRIDLACPSHLQESLPMKFVLIEDLALPWTHANMQLVQKTSMRDSYDLWVRIPSGHRFQKKYIEDTAKEILEILKARLPGSEPAVVDYPQDYLYDEATLGPSRFVVYNDDRLNQIKRKNYSNIHHDSTDLCDSMDWVGQFSHQNRVFEFIKSWKTEVDRKIEKQKAKERESV